MDLRKRKVFLLLLGVCGIILLLLANLVDFGSSHEIFVVAANFHNSSHSYLTSLNLNLSILSKDNHELQQTIAEERLKSSIHKLLRNPKVSVTDETLRYKNKHNKSNIHNDNSYDFNDKVSNSLANEQSNSGESRSKVTEPFDRNNNVNTEPFDFNKNNVESKTKVTNAYDPDKDITSKSGSYIETESDSNVRTNIVSANSFIREKNRELRPVHSLSVLNSKHPTFSDTNAIFKKNQNVEHVEDDRKPYHDVSVYKTQTTRDVRTSDGFRNLDDQSRETKPDNPEQIHEEVIIPDNLGPNNEVPYQNRNVENHVDNGIVDVGLSEKSVIPTNKQVESRVDSAVPFGANSLHREVNGSIKDSNPYVQEKLNRIPSQVEQSYHGKHEYKPTREVSKMESLGRQTGHVDTDHGKDSVNEEEFTVDSSCIRRVTGVEDILCMNRPQFSPDFRNPCWYQRGSLRCLPYFHIIGVCKTGTTDLFERLSHHPQILKNKGILGKETWYWTWRRYGHSNFYNVMTDRKTLDNFIDQFDADAIERYTKRMPNGSLYHPVVTGHGDPMDFWDQSSWKSIPQNDPTADIPEVTTPSLIKHVNPNVKLILILRDPVERLFSNYLHGQFGTTAAQFHQDVLASQSLLTSCTRDRSMKSCLYDEDIIRSLRVPISGSFYSIHLQEWLKVFPRKQIFITRTEDFSKSIADTLLRIFRFLHLDPLPTRDLYRIANMPHFYNTKAKETSGEVQDETRDILHAMFEPYNNELAAILNDQKYNFNVDNNI